MRVTVFGAGSLGSLVGGLLAAAHDVTLVGRADHVEAIRRDGLGLAGEYDRTVHPEARTTLPGTTGLVLVTVKSHDTRAAAEALAAELGEAEAVLSLQNGMGNEAVLADELDVPVLAGTTTFGARLREPGVVACTGVGEVTLGPRNRGSSPVAERVGEAFRAAGIETTVADDMERRLWRKLAVNAGINATTALARLPNGALRDGPAGETAAAAAREVVQVAREEEMYLDEQAVLGELRRVVRTTAGNLSSMRQDVRRGRRTEVDAINGYVVSRADQPVPVNETLTALVRAWERKRGLR
jgi:2-dehydropantoate 2-reductase